MIIGREVDQQRFWGVLRWQKHHFCVLVEKLQGKKKENEKEKRKETRKSMNYWTVAWVE